MKHVRILIVSVFFITIIFSYLYSGYLFPADVLNNIPSFSESTWSRPQNALQADPVYQFEPWRDFAKKELLQGRFPLWNNLNGNGAPLFANSISAVLFPLNVLYYIFPAKLAILLMAMLKLTAFFVFLFLYLRVLQINRTIALLGGLAATFSGYMILWLQWPQTNVYLFLPLLLYLTEKIYIGRSREYRWYCLISATYFLAILGNHPETLFHLTMLHLAYVLFRFKTNIKQIAAIYISIFFGFLLGAVQLLPFIEYLQNSYVLESRSTVRHEFYLPLISGMLNFFPYLFGGPHLAYYRPIASGTNFQEALGGYTGLIILFSAVLGTILYRKVSQIVFWGIVVLISIVLSYNIWPFKYINALPLVSTSANHRLIGFAGFGLTILFCLTLNMLTQRKKILTRLVIPNKIFLLLFSTIVVIAISGAIFLPGIMPKYADFFPYLLSHVSLMLLSTLFFFWVLSLYVTKRLSAAKLLLATIFLVLIQTLGLFWNYNPIVADTYFYPTTDVVKILEWHKKGNILEVGNPVLPPEVNIKYGIPHVVNNDAVEIAWYRHAFDKAFPRRNHWGNPDEVSSKSLREFVSAYVLSDYDITLKKIKIQPDAAGVLSPLTRKHSYGYTFRPPTGSIKQIRIRTANFNRVNTCIVTFRLLNLKTEEIITSKNISCEDIRNNVFYTFTITPILVHAADEYKIDITSDTNNGKNAIALWGSKDKPFIEFLYEQEGGQQDYGLLNKTKSTYIWRIKKTALITGAQKYAILHENPQELVIDVTTTHATNLLVKKTYYPGWQAVINGKSVLIKNANPFMKIPVGKGRNYIELTYHPFSFFAGLAVTIISFLGFVIFIFRKEKVFLLSLYKHSPVQKNIKMHTFSEHSLVIGVGLVLSIGIFTLYVILFPSNIENPWTTAINWFTLHQYPRYQDYFYFIVGFIFTFFFTLLLWLVWICKKNR